VSDDGRIVNVQPGVVAETNGIALMEPYGIDRVLIAQAEAICEWYGGYVAHPDKIPANVLSG
jgi:hypothetical protein